jgi:hypothetical protein
MLFKLVVKFEATADLNSARLLHRRERSAWLLKEERKVIPSAASAILRIEEELIWDWLGAALGATPNQNEQYKAQQNRKHLQSKPH